MELLRSWVNDELKLSRPVSSFEVDMANGYLIGEILVRHGLLPGHAPLEALQDKESPNAKISNFGMVQQALLDLGVKFDSQIANSIMTEKKGVATNLCYQLRLGLQNAKGAGKPVTRRGVAEPVLMGSTIKVAQPSTAQPAAVLPVACASAAASRAYPSICSSRNSSSSGMAMRRCSVESRSRSVTVPSPSIVSKSMVTQ